MRLCGFTFISWVAAGCGESTDAGNRGLDAGSDPELHAALALYESLAPDAPAPDARLIELPLRDALSLALGDIDADGSTDAVIVGGPDAAYQIVVVRGLAGDPEPEPLDLSLPDHGSVRLVDLDEDGAPELLAIVPGGGRFLIFANAGDGTFEAAREPMERHDRNNVSYALHTIDVADLEPDGDLDVVAAGGNALGLQTLLADGAAGFRHLDPDEKLTNDVAKAIAIWDATGDDVADVVALTFDGAGSTDICVYQGAGDGSFAPCARSARVPDVFPEHGRFTDVTGDGVRDAVIATESDVRLVRGLPEGGFGSTEVLLDDPAFDGIGALVLADVTGDAVLDIVGRTGDQLFVFPATGPLSFGARSDLQIPTPGGAEVELNAIAAGDADADTVADVALLASYYRYSGNE